MTENSNDGINPALDEREHRQRQMFRVSEHVRATHGSDGVTVLDIRLGQMFRLNVVGARIFELLKDGIQEPEIVDRIAQEFCVSAKTAEGDVRDFLIALMRAGLIEEQRR